jgi:hypothetical protein
LLAYLFLRIIPANLDQSFLVNIQRYKKRDFSWGDNLCGNIMKLLAILFCFGALLSVYAQGKDETGEQATSAAVEESGDSGEFEGNKM